jgi:type IV pilus assembly protein PilX
MKMSLVLSESRMTALRPTQAGISLVIVMIFLVILSGLAISAMQGSTFSARVAGNESDRTLAFQAAEAALKDAENDLNSFLSTGTACPSGSSTCRAVPIYRGDDFDASCSNGRCASDPLLPPPSPFWETASNWSNASPASNSAISNGSVVYGFYTGATALPVVSQQPRYLIEYFKQGDFSVYRVTAVGYGASATTQAILQTAVKAKQI